MPNYTRTIFITAFLFVASITMAQDNMRIHGRVYDMNRSPLEAVSVMTKSGYGTFTDSLGKFSIRVEQNDSIWFSYLNKPTPKFAVSSIANKQNFELSLHVNITQLKEVRVMPPSYRRDSIQNRLDYAKAFNFSKPGVGTSVLPLNSGGAGVGLDLGEFISMFQFRKNRRMLAFQERLLQEEEDKFIYNRFSRALVIRITTLRGTDLDTFMIRYKPTAEFVRMATDYEFQSYIKTASVRYSRMNKFLDERNRKDRPF